MNAKRLLSVGFAFFLLMLLMASTTAAPHPAFAADEPQPALDKFTFLPRPLSSTTATPISPKSPITG